MFNSKLKIVSVAIVALLAVTVTSCTDDLNTSPIDDDVQTSESVYTSPDNYRQVLAKLYAGFATTGQQGPAGNPDIQGIDEGFSSYLRQLWVAQVITTDEAVVGWNDDGLPEFNYHEWNSSNDFVMALYSRIFYQITLANEFIRNAQDSDDESVQQYLAEARFLRALSYWHALDLFGGGVPFVTEEDPVGAYQPEPVGAQELFNYIESELTAIEDEMPDPGQNDYGRADKGAVWTLLTKLYLNAEVYIDEARYGDAITYANNVIDQGGYTLENDYQNLFLADNHEASGVIFAIPFDGVNTQTYGGTTFIHHAALGGNMNPSNFGTNEAWAGHRVTPQFADLLDNNNDSRNTLFTDGQEKEIPELAEFTNGYAITKWKNITKNGQSGSDPVFVDTDFPMFRLADVYLMYAEATERGGSGGDEAKAVDLINDLRERAYGDNSENITAGDLDLEFIIDERARELYWEAHRRTDLRRFGLYTGNDYVWAWKGENSDGSGTDDTYEIFPIPAPDVNSNLNLEQNPGY